MVDSERDELGKYFAVFDKGIKESGGDDESSAVPNPLGRKKYWVHPYLVLKAFSGGLIATETWGEESPDSAWKMIGSVKKSLLAAYPDVAKLSVADVHRSLTQWTNLPEFKEWSEEVGVDMGLVVKNAVLALAVDLKAMEADFIRLEESLGVEDEAETESKAS